MAGGRPTKYSTALAKRICTAIAGGKSLISICKRKDYPVISTVLLWVVDGNHKEFSEQYAQAREAQGHYQGDRISQIVDDLIDGSVEPQTAKVAVDALKWVAERQSRKVYGSAATEQPKQINNFVIDTSVKRD